ncbi:MULTISPECIES: peptidoglycan-binding domain-containing protein [Streptomyces]|uniref:peptidoglycan-binding domain-containing protein n=1 Tax=Streptomyces TaxID=1883 RepID=UPI001603AFA4|nr:peptidoglycan-binding domain-containing protein [Streptomyces murinus]MBA9050511.1 peptidoglycan hydrolase-like protein with peptidoglycan-binding domain [Streptomyces murinus]
MRSIALTRTLVSVTAVVGMAAGGLAGASASFATSQPTAKPAVSVQHVSILAVNNLGLTTTQAKHWQCELRMYHFDPGTIDGQLGTNSWKAAQKLFNEGLYYVDKPLVVDGIVGTETIKALQSYLNSEGWGLTVDGVAGSETRAAFASHSSVDFCSL